MRHQILPSLALVSLVTACGDAPTPVGPSVAPLEAARAAQNERAPDEVDSTPFQVDVVNATCGFAVEIVLTGLAKTIVLPGDRTLVLAPGQHVTLTNVENDRTVTLNVTGAFHQTQLPNRDVRTVATGRNLLWDPIAGFVLVTGRFTYAFDATGNLVQPLQGTGSRTDVCALLA